MAENINVAVDNSPLGGGAVTYDESPNYMRYDAASNELWAWADPLDLRPTSGDYDRYNKYRYNADTGAYIGLVSDPLPDNDGPTGTNSSDEIFFGYLGSNRVYFSREGVYSPNRYWVCVGDTATVNVQRDAESGGGIRCSITGDGQYLMEWHSATNNYYIFDNTMSQIKTGSIAAVRSAFNSIQAGNITPQQATTGTSVGTLEYADGMWYFWARSGGNPFSQESAFLFDLTDGDAVELDRLNVYAYYGGANGMNLIAINGSFYWMSRQDNLRMTRTGVSGTELALAVEADTGNVHRTTTVTESIFWT